MVFGKVQLLSKKLNNMKKIDPVREIIAVFIVIFVIFVLVLSLTGGFKAPPGKLKPKVKGFDVAYTIRADNDSLHVYLYDKYIGSCLWEADSVRVDSIINKNIKDNE